MLAANDAIVSGRYWFDGGPTPETKVLPTRAATSLRVGTEEQVELAVVVGQESAGSVGR